MMEISNVRKIQVQIPKDLFERAKEIARELENADEDFMEDGRQQPREQQDRDLDLPS